MSGSYGKTRFAAILFDAYGKLYDVQCAMRFFQRLERRRSQTVRIPLLLGKAFGPAVRRARRPDGFRPRTFWPRSQVWSPETER